MSAIPQPTKPSRDWRADLRDVGKLWVYLRPYRSRFFLGIAMLLLAVPLGQVAVFLTRDVTNQILNSANATVEQRWDTVVRILLLQAGLWLAGQILSVWREVLEWYVSMRSTLDLRLRYYRHLLRLPLRFLEQRPPGEHLYRSTADMVSMFRLGNRVETSTPAGQMPPDSKEVQMTYYYANDVDPFDPGVMGVLTRSAPLFVETTYALTWGGILLSLIDPVLSLFLIAYIIPFAWVSTKAFDKVRLAAFDFKTEVESESAVLRDSVAGMRTLKALGRTAGQRKRFYEAAGYARRAGLRLFIELVKTQNLKQQGMRWVFTACVYLYLAKRIVDGYATIGDWVATALLLEAAQMPLQNLVQLSQLLKMQLVPIRRILSTLEIEPTIVDRPGAKPAGPLEGRLTFDGLDFEYREGEPVIRGLHLDIQPGEHVGIVGPSGAGKSSLINLALRLYDPVGGGVKVDGADLRDIQLESYLNQVASVSQQTHLYAGTIEDNIRFGKPDATPAEIDAALKASGVDAFLGDHPDGLQTDLGEVGSLSGGERQRIGIARALVRNPRILFMDEATASLDPATEARILDVVEQIRPGRTILTIAHRLKAVVPCDRIIVLDKGEIRQMGSHAELVTQPGLYQDLWQGQAREAGE